MGPEAVLNVAEKRNISYFCQKSNPASVIQPLV
jgi:hypothetical protein